MAENEADGGSADGHSVTCAHRADALRLIQHVGGRRRVVIGRAWAGSGQYPAVEDARGEYRDAAPLAGREQGVRGGDVKQRVAAGHEHEVQVGALDEPLEQRCLVHADADCPDSPLGTKLVQGGVSSI